VAVQLPGLSSAAEQNGQSQFLPDHGLPRSNPRGRKTGFPAKWLRNAATKIFSRFSVEKSPSLTK
jgi:hypothetical protein